MNAKKTKAVRHAMRSNGTDPRNTEYSAKYHNKGPGKVPAIQIFLSSDCGRSQYKAMKRAVAAMRK